MRLSIKEKIITKYLEKKDKRDTFKSTNINIKISFIN